MNELEIFLRFLIFDFNPDSQYIFFPHRFQRGPLFKLILRKKIRKVEYCRHVDSSGDFSTTISKNRGDPRGSKKIK